MFTKSASSVPEPRREGQRAWEGVNNERKSSPCTCSNSSVPSRPWPLPWTYKVTLALKIHEHSTSFSPPPSVRPSALVSPLSRPRRVSFNATKVTNGERLPQRRRLAKQESGSGVGRRQSSSKSENARRRSRLGQDSLWTRCVSHTPYHHSVQNLTGLIFFFTFLVFRVPTTHDVITALFNPLQPKSHIDLVNLALLGLQVVIFIALPKSFTGPFFFLYFAFWRAAYDVGLGWVLTKQSKKKWIVREVQRRGWLDAEKRPKVREWIKNELSMKMDADYNFDVRRRP